MNHTTDNIQEARARASVFLVGYSLLVVAVCWLIPLVCWLTQYFAALPYSFEHLIDTFLLLPQWGYSFFGIPVYFPFGIVLFFSILVIFRRCYPLVLLAPIICVFFFLPQMLDPHFPGTWYDPIVQTEDVLYIAPYFADYEPRHYLDIRQHKEVEIPISILLWGLTPTCLIGLWGTSVLARPSVRRVFRPIFRNKVIDLSVEYDLLFKNEYLRALSRGYGVLIFLLLFALLPTALLNIVDTQRQYWMIPPPNPWFSILLIIGLLFGGCSYFGIRFYGLAILAPILWFLTGRFSLDTSSFVFFFPENVPVIIIFATDMFSRVMISGLGIFIWWKNRTALKEPHVKRSVTCGTR